jgi:heme-degrading monooxygenase HmoA
MVREHALLPVIPGQEQAFEAALAEALPLICASPGFIGLSVSRGIETPGQYLLLVEWSDLAAHTEGFRGSPAYEQWRALLHHFYDPFPDVQHFADVVTG